MATLWTSSYSCTRSVISTDMSTTVLLPASPFSSSANRPSKECSPPDMTGILYSITWFLPVSTVCLMASMIFAASLGGRTSSVNRPIRSPRLATKRLLSFAMTSMYRPCSSRTKDKFGIALTNALNLLSRSARSSLDFVSSSTRSANSRFARSSWTRRLRRIRCVSTRARTSSYSNGLRIKSTAPERNALVFPSILSSALIKMTGIPLVRASFLSLSQISKPSIPGILMSSRMISGGVVWAISIACVPWSAAWV